MKNKTTKNRGFTLIELLVVISIIGLLSSVVFAATNSARNKARIAAVTLGIKEMQNALEIYRSDTGYYPFETEIGGAYTFSTPAQHGSETDEMSLVFRSTEYDGLTGLTPLMPKYISQLPTPLPGDILFFYDNQSTAIYPTYCGNKLVRGYFISYYDQNRDSPLPLPLEGGADNVYCVGGDMGFNVPTTF